MNYSTIDFALAGNVAHVRLNRPGDANAINSELAQDLMVAALHCDESPQIRAVVLSGAGKMFCGGGDLKSFAAQGEDLPAHVKRVTTNLHAAVSRFTRMEAPTVCAVQGAAAGGGLSLAMSCDLVVAAESAKFTMAYTKAGLTPDGSSTYFLARHIGLRRALELALTNRVLSAAEALEWGLISRVVPDDQLESETMTLATKLASGATSALGTAKRLLHSGLTETLETQMELEARAIADSTRTADSKEGIAAFLEKRKPTFPGR